MIRREEGRSKNIYIDILVSKKLYTYFYLFQLNKCYSKYRVVDHFFIKIFYTHNYYGKSKKDIKEVYKEKCKEDKENYKAISIDKRKDIRKGVFSFENLNIKRKPREALRRVSWLPRGRETFDWSAVST